MTAWDIIVGALILAMCYAFYRALKAHRHQRRLDREMVRQTQERILNRYAGSFHPNIGSLPPARDYTSKPKHRQYNARPTLSKPYGSAPPRTVTHDDTPSIGPIIVIDSGTPAPRPRPPAEEPAFSTGGDVPSTTFRTGGSDAVPTGFRTGGDDSSPSWKSSTPSDGGSKSDWGGSSSSDSGGSSSGGGDSGGSSGE